MDFVVDKVSEDSFYENLLLGLPKVLDKSVGIKDTFITRYPPITHVDICNWEQKNGVLLPEDLRSFFTSTNGFLFTWTYSYSDDDDEAWVLGKLEVNPLQDILPVYGYETKNDSGVNMDGDRYELRLSPDSKIFELLPIEGMGRVVLVYLHNRYDPTIWLLVTQGMEFYYLSDDFITYFRMSVAHLGIPNWQFAFTPQGVPQWTEQVFTILVPHLLPLDRKLEAGKKGKEGKTDDDYPEIQLNKVDSNIFKLLPRTPAAAPPPLPEVPQEKQEPAKVPKKKSERLRPPIKFQRKPLYYKK